MDYTIRKLDIEDIPDVQEIYEMITGQQAPDSDELESRMDYGESLLCVGAEKNGKLVGFMFGHTERGSYGEMDPIGIIGLLGVHPDFRKNNLGRALGKELLSQFKGIGITKVRTRVDNNQTDLLKYFMNLGLKPSNWTMLEIDSL